MIVGIMTTLYTGHRDNSTAKDMASLAFSVYIRPLLNEGLPHALPNFLVFGSLHPYKISYLFSGLSFFSTLKVSSRREFDLRSDFLVNIMIALNQKSKVNLIPEESLA